MVLKPSENCTALCLSIHEAGVPPGVFNMGMARGRLQAMTMNRGLASWRPGLETPVQAVQQPPDMSPPGRLQVRSVAKR